MTTDEIRQKIASVNARGAKLNNERQVNLGKRETLVQQLQAGIKAYQEKYGVTITENDIEAELQKVSTEKEQALQSLEQLISLIEAGRYVDATNMVNKLNGVETTQQPVASAPVESTVSISQPVASTPLSQPVASAPVMPNVGQPVEPTVPVMPNVGQPQVAQPMQPAMSQVSAPNVGQPFGMGNSLNDALAGFTAPTAPIQGLEGVTPVVNNNVTDFNAILAGTPFANPV